MNKEQEFSRATLAGTYPPIKVKEQIHIDQNIKYLVQSINDIPGIETYASCGGHPSPLKEGQRAEGEFVVQFLIEENSWKSLHRLARSVRHFNETVVSTVCHLWALDNEGDECLSFCLGCVDVDDEQINKFADILAAGESNEN